MQVDNVPEHAVALSDVHAMGRIVQELIQTRLPTTNGTPLPSVAPVTQAEDSDEN